MEKYSVEVNDFINKEFDLLISYYNIEKTILLKVTHSSRALFKVGFSSIDKRLNHFMIQTDGSDFKLFISELFKYLKILKKYKYNMQALIGTGVALVTPFKEDFHRSIIKRIVHFR
jgi:hypothetical protein